MGWYEDFCAGPWYSSYYNISSVIEKMNAEQKGILWLYLEHGRDVNDYAGSTLKSPEQLRSIGETITAHKIASKMFDAIRKGMGVHDILVKCLDEYYGRQMDLVIKEVFIDGMGMPVPSFVNHADTWDGAVERERYIAEKILDKAIESMTEADKGRLSEEVSRVMQSRGISAGDATLASAAIMQGGLTAMRAILGFNFHIYLAIIVNAIVKAITGAGLSLAANAAMHRFAAAIWGPWGWVIGGIMSLPVLFPRRYDKYLPALFMIAVARIEQEAESERLQHIAA